MLLFLQTCNFLTVGFGLVATINLDPSSVNLFKVEEDAKLALSPISMAQIMGVPVKVCNFQCSTFKTAYGFVLLALKCEVIKFSRCSHQSVGWGRGRGAGGLVP